jgi:hypothetical protein
MYSAAIAVIVNDFNFENFWQSVLLKLAKALQNSEKNVT